MALVYSSEERKDSDSLRHRTAVRLFAATSEELAANIKNCANNIKKTEENNFFFIKQNLFFQSQKSSI